MVRQMFVAFFSRKTFSFYSMETGVFHGLILFNFFPIVYFGFVCVDLDCMFGMHMVQNVAAVS